jgi:hypothetical protein
MIMDNTHDRNDTVMVRRGVSQRPVDVRQTTSAPLGRSTRRTMSLEHTLHDQVRSLRMELSDLKIQVSDLAAALERE